MDDALTCQKATIGYPGRPLLEGLEFRVPSGAFVCIVGANGAGKSTLVKSILGLVPLLEGEITLRTGGRIGYLPQQNEALQSFPASVWEVALSGVLGRRPWWRPCYTASECGRVRRCLEMTGMAEFSRRSFRELSGGQRQRVLLARALAAAEGLLLLDEPVAGLDPEATARMYQLLDEAHAAGETILMVSHDVETALAHATHVLHLGAAWWFGTVDEFQQRAAGRAPA
jgi:zinc transport system ATP-binding protein